jgi:hypothetical protein
MVRLSSVTCAQQPELMQQHYSKLPGGLPASFSMDNASSSSAPDNFARFVDVSSNTSPDSLPDSLVWSETSAASLRPPAISETKKEQTQAIVVFFPLSAPQCEWHCAHALCSWTLLNCWDLVTRPHQGRHATSQCDKLYGKGTNFMQDHAAAMKHARSHSKHT